jgi:hypothetical protein
MRNMKRLTALSVVLLALAQNALAAFPASLNSAAAAIPVWIANAPSGQSGGTITSSTVGPAKAGVSIDGGSVGTTASTIITAGKYTGWVTIQNTSAANTLYISFGTATTGSFAIAPGASLTLQFGPTNALSGVGSAANTTFATVGY